MMSLSNGVTVKWCHCKVMSMSNDVNVKWCHCQVMSLSSDVTVKWCQCQMMSLSSDVTVKWCHWYYIITCNNLHQAIYNYIPEANHVSRLDTVAAVLHIQHMLHVILFPMLNILYFCISTPPPAVATWRHAFPVRCLGIFWVILKIIPVASLIAGITFVSKFHMRRASIVRVSYFKMLSTSFLNQIYVF